MTDRRLSRNEALRDGWFAAAHVILSTEGYGALKLAALCRRLRVTTGSFYHSFDSWQDFTDALLDNWMTERTADTVALVVETADPLERLKLIVQATYELPHSSEAAIRVWAGVDPRVAAVQRQVDEARYQVVHDALEPLVGPERAEAFTVWGVSTLIGYEMLAKEHTREHLLWSVEEILADAQRVARNDKRKAARKAAAAGDSEEL
ncbi:MAG: TetR/AcrR family transcriptional regulator [Micrococcales bacterium]|nr:TetR/AcrR family transcriptional regulator [Micrococcales bacterium]MCL2541588.1 TetR/AcrR family transcriptional regulator [Nocardioidaceae bacterium]MCL2612895.1 TetR/AcrR family transcriptional regulator [Nocardioidaceae bacterium]